MAAAVTAAAPPNLTSLRFHGWREKPTFSISPTTLRFFRNSSRTKHLTQVLALVDEQQQQQQVSFTEEENSLVEALIGIQGRGRSASPQQLTVTLFSLFSS